MATIKKTAKKMQMGGRTKPMMKKGGSFPDLNKDGKLTKKDVLIGRGVLPKTAKKGMKIKKAQDGKTQERDTPASTFVKMKETPSKTVSKFKSAGGNYTEKFKWGKDKSEGPTVTQRRTIKGLLSGAPKAAGKLGKLSDMIKPMKKGGKMTKKCMHGCK